METYGHKVDEYALHLRPIRSSGSTERELEEEARAQHHIIEAEPNELKRWGS